MAGVTLFGDVTTKMTYDSSKKIHANGMKVAKGIKTYADDERAVVFTGGNLQDFINNTPVLFNNGMTVNDCLISAERQTAVTDINKDGKINDTDKKLTPLEVGDVIIIKGKKPCTVDQGNEVLEAEATKNNRERKQERWLRASATVGSFAAVGAGIGAFGGPVGAAIGAGIGAVVGLIGFFIVRGCKENRAADDKALEKAKENAGMN